MNNFSIDVQVDEGTGTIVMTETISFLSILSLTAIATTISLFFCGLPICFEIYRRRSTLEISCFPFLMGFLGGSYWLRYGFLRADLTMISVNVVGVTLMGFYLLFYTYYSESRVGTLTKIAVVVAIISGMLVLVELYGVQIVDPLGFTTFIGNNRTNYLQLCGEVSETIYRQLIVMKIVLKSSDNKVFEVDRDVIRLSTTLNNMFQDLGTDDPENENCNEAITLPNVKGTVLSKVIQWCQNDEDFDMEDGISDWAKEFLQSCQSVLFELIVAATYLDIPGLLELLRNSTFTMIKAECKGSFKPIEGYIPFDDNHYGQADEMEREKQLIECDRKFEDLYDFTDRFQMFQIKQSLAYDAFPVFKQRIFHHYFKAWECFISDPIAFEEFGDVSRTTILRICCELADVQNENLHKDDCWIASKKFEAKGRERPTTSIGKHSAVIVFRLLGKMRFGIQAFPDTYIEASHLCGLNDCIRDDHCVPESGLVNKSRDKCHKSGCAKTCTHTPKCLFQRFGRHLPCRSDPELEKCECELKCFIGVTFEKKEKPKVSSRKRKIVEEESDQDDVISGEKPKWTPLKAVLTDAMLVGPNLKFNGYSYSIHSSGMKKIEDPATGKKRLPKVSEVDNKNATWGCSQKKTKKCNGRAITAEGMCMIFNIVNFGAPLAGVGIVLKKKCCDSLPLPLCTANLLVSAQWCLYGMLVNDIYIIIPNAAGVFLALLQISMFLVFPRQAGSKAPLSLCFGCLDFELDEKQNSVDIEKAFAQDLWLKRNTTFQSSLPPLSRIPKPKKNCLTLIRTANVFPSGSVSANSSDTAITVLPNWSLTPSASHPELAPQQLDSEEVERDQMFNRMHEIDDLEKQWGENELKRTMSAPDLAESSVLSVRQAADELNLS